MKRVITLAIAMCFPLSAFAECPVVVPADERTRIVECTDGSYALQRLGTMWVTTMGCGYELSVVRETKRWHIIEDALGDAIDCPTPPARPKYPLVIVR